MILVTVLHHPHTALLLPPAAAATTTTMQHKKQITRVGWRMRRPGQKTSGGAEEEEGVEDGAEEKKKLSKWVGREQRRAERGETLATGEWGKSSCLAGTEERMKPGVPSDGAETSCEDDEMKGWGLKPSARAEEM